jgi:branched-chain amino acid transport system permease protein
VAAVAALVQVLPDQYDVHVVRAVVMALIALSIVALTGLSGQLSLAQYLFVGVGAFVSGEVLGNGTVPGMLLGGVVAGALGLLVALPSRNLRGLHLALCTFGFALAGREVLIGDSRVFGLGGVPIDRPTVVGFDTSSNAAFAVRSAIVFGWAAVGLVALRRSRFGRRLTAIRDSEIGAATMGVQVRTAKVLIFGVSSFIAGCAGSLYGGLQGIVDATQLEPVNGLVIVLFAFVGGVTSVTGALIAGALFALLAFAQQEFPSLAGLVFVGVGAAAVALGRQPNGLAGIVLGAVRRRERPVPLDEPAPVDVGAAA